MASTLGNEPATVGIGDEFDAAAFEIFGNFATVLGALGDEVAVANSAACFYPVLDEQFGRIFFIEQRNTEADECVGAGATFTNFALIDEENLGAGPRCFERRPGGGGAAADYEDIGCEIV